MSSSRWERGRSVRIQPLNELWVRVWTEIERAAHAVRTGTVRAPSAISKLTNEKSPFENLHSAVAGFGFFDRTKQKADHRLQSSNLQCLQAIA